MFVTLPNLTCVSKLTSLEPVELFNEVEATVWTYEVFAFVICDWPLIEVTTVPKSINVVPSETAYCLPFNDIIFATPLKSTVVLPKLVQEYVVPDCDVIYCV